MTFDKLSLITIRTLIALTILFGVNPAYSAPSNESIIHSDKLVVEEQKDIATFSGNVVYEHDGTTLKSERMIAFYHPQNNNVSNSRSVKKIEVYENVEIITPQERATGKSGYYEAADETFYLLGDVKMYSEDSVMYGEKFIYNKKSGKSLLLGNKNEKGKKASQPKLILK